ncbi:FMN-binding negative transcriptional regulator [Pseudoalteromonas sp. L1]|uniref:FMN-binding negative transcriptional regulator n=1 Tax=Pseudoalteromonas sp. L1 TaxID=195716 RepID=UPI001F330F0F|nr:FMN-binding negative transcriptional regulator [Pseudoalteromonas sp. L1]
MHIPNKWKMTPERVSQFIKNYSFALMIDSEFEATHLPLVYKPEEGEFGTLYGHVSRANRHGKSLQDTRVLVVFNGPRIPKPPQDPSFSWN